LHRCSATAIAFRSAPASLRRFRALSNALALTGAAFSARGGCQGAVRVNARHGFAISGQLAAFLGALAAVERVVQRETI